MAYTIGSQKGQQIANGMKAGQTYNASDGSSWTKNANGTVTVIHNGVVTQNALPSASSGGVSAPKASAPVASQPVKTAPSVGSGGYATTGTGNSQGYTGTMQATDPNGTKISVQYQNGKLVSNVPDGTIIHTNGGDFAYYKPQEQEKQETPQQNTTTTPNTTLVNQYQGLYSPGGDYDKAAEEERKAKEAAVNKAVGDLESQKGDVNQSYSDLFRQLYIDKMMATKNLDQKLAAQGITGGMAESTRMGYDTSYAEALRQGETQRLNTLGDLDKAITDTRLTGDISIAQSAADSSRNRVNSYAGVLQSLIGRNDNLALQSKTDADNRQAQARNLVLQMLQSGMQPSDDLLAASGIGAGDAQTILGQGIKNSYTAEQVAAALAAARSGQGTAAVRNIIEGYYGLPMETVMTTQAGKTTYTTEQVAAALAAAKNGQATDAVRSMVESYFGLPLETVLAGQTEETAYSDAAVVIALEAAQSGNRSNDVRKVIEGYYSLPMEVVLAYYGY